MNFLFNHRRYFTLYTLALVSIGIIGFGACSSDNEEDLFGCSVEASSLLSFKDCVAPILETNCSISCHNANNAFGGVVMETYEEIKVYVDNDALPNVLRATNEYSIMPPTGMLPEADLALIEKWLNEGALNN